MSPNSKMVPLPGSERKALSSARAVGPADPDHRIEVTVYVRRNPAAKPPPPSEVLKLPRQRGKPLTPEQAADIFGAAPEDLAKVEAYARANNLVVLETSRERRSVLLSGTVAQFSQAFGVKLRH